MFACMSKLELKPLRVKKKFFRIELLTCKPWWWGGGDGTYALIRIKSRVRINQKVVRRNWNGNLHVCILIATNTFTCAL